MAMSLSELRTARDEVELALHAVVAGKTRSVQIGDRNVTYEHPGPLRRQLAYLNWKINNREKGSLSTFDRTARIVTVAEDSNGASQ